MPTVSLLVCAALGSLFGWACTRAVFDAVTPSSACVRFTEASDDLLRLTVRLAGISRAGASAASAGNAERLARVVVRLDVLQSDLSELSPRYAATKEECLA